MYVAYKDTDIFLVSVFNGGIPVQWENKIALVITIVKTNFTYYNK